MAGRGAREVTFDPEFETAVVDAPDRALARTLLNLNCDGYQNGWMARRTPTTNGTAGNVCAANSTPIWAAFAPA